jgi:hypothetical protein
MATGMNAPVLLARRMGLPEAFTGSLTAAYGAFGIAWRLMDDWHDWKTDLAGGAHSAVYFALPPGIRPLWGHRRPPDKTAKPSETIRHAVYQGGVRERLRERIRFELTSAAALLDGLQMAGMADELRCLAGPLAP